MDFREFSQKMILCALETGVNLENGGPMYKKAIKRELIGQFSEVYRLNGCEKKFFGKINKSMKKQKAYDVILVSEEYLKAIDKGEVPYYEHIEPINLTFVNLCQLMPPITLEKVGKAMEYCKIVGLSKKQKYLLDGQKFTQYDYDRINNNWRKIIGNEEVDKSLSSMKSKDGRWLSCQENGTAYARMAHLINNGVKFVWGADPNPRPGKFQEETISDYLKNKEYNYKI